MSIGKIFKGGSKFIAKNSPVILTGLTVAGIVTTSYLVGKASWRASELVRAEEETSGKAEDGWPTVKARAKMVWPMYVPALVVGTITVSSAIFSTSISNRRNAALISAYALSETAFKEYREKVVEQIGKNKELKVRDDIVKDKVEAADVGDIVIFGTGNVLCFDTLTGRAFESNMEAIRKAENDINRQCINEMYASQNDFYRKVGLPEVPLGEELGWNNDNPLELQFTSVLIEDKPVLAINYRVQPRHDYHKLW